MDDETTRALAGGAGALLGAGVSGLLGWGMTWLVFRPKRGFKRGQSVVVRNTGDFAWQHSEQELAGQYWRRREHHEHSAERYPHCVLVKGRLWNFSEAEVFRG